VDFLVVCLILNRFSQLFHQNPKGCARRKAPGVYSRISSALPWIRDTVCQNSFEHQPSFCTSTTVNNGNVDSNGSSGNDGESIIIDQTTDSPKGGHVVQIDIKYDANPEQVAWIFVNADTGETIDVVRIGTAATPDQAVSLRYPNLLSGNYMFLITDSNQDGICCLSGTGWIVISEVAEDGSTQLLWADNGGYGDGAVANFELFSPGTAVMRDLDDDAV
jgi:hypothetical protein